MAKFKLIHKGLILIVLPLAIQTAFLYELKSRLHQAEVEAQTQEVSKRLLVKVNTVLIECGDWLEMILSTTTSIKNKSSREHRMLARHEHLIDALRDLNSYLKSEYRDPIIVGRIQGLTDDFLVECDALSAIVIDKPVSVDLFLQTVDSQKKFQKAFDRLKFELIRFARAQEKRTNESFALQQKTRESVEQLVNAVAVANILMAVAVMIYFMRGIGSRINVIADNAKRFSQGEALHEPISGKDEVSELDRVFHEMANAVETSRLKEMEVMKLLRVSEAQLTELINNLPFALITISTEGKIESVNPTAQRLLSYSSDQIVGHRINKVLPTLYSTGNLKKVTLDLLERTSEAPLETEAESLEGEYVPVEISLTDFDSEGERTFVATMNDITERKRLELMKQNFYSMVSHDIRSPLASVGTLLELVLDGAGGTIPEDAANKLQRAQKSCARLQQMVRHLLDLEKFSAGVVELEKSQFPAAELLLDSTQSFEGLGTEKGITIEMDECEGEIDGDRDLLQRVVENFISNAMKYSPDGGKVQVRSRVKNGFVEVSVTDQGPGVPSQMRETVFEKFKQVNTSDRKRGFGLGLAICKSIIEQHGGQIGVEPAESGGSRFWFAVPSAA